MRTSFLLFLLSAFAWAGEVLPNGIVLPDQWPPRTEDPKSRKPMSVPYLNAPPAVIPIDVGRQLFVDDFLIENSTLERRYHQARKHEGNPILKATTELELHNGFRPGACPHSGGAWYDHREGLYKMWYMTGWYGGSALAVSKDGVHYDRRNLDFRPGTNHIPDPSPELRFGMDHVRIDWFTRDESQRFKSLHFYHATEKGQGGRVHTSSDGLHWSAPTPTGPSGDRNTFFYNPFRRKWIYSIKVQAQDAGKSRARNYWEHSDFLRGAQWKPEEPVFWIGADDLDPPDPAIGDPPQIYDLDGIAYESLMLGMFQVHRGPHNSLAEKGKFPKMSELSIGFSRDGFHWSRPDRRPFIAATRKQGDWERAYVQFTGGVTLIDGDRLLFYYVGFSGEAPNGPDMYAGCATGLATLRRDGFASLDASASGGTLTTRKVRFSGNHLFVNLDAPKGELRAEILDEQSRPIAPFTAANSIPLTTDSTKVELKWKGNADLAALAGRAVRIRFHLRSGSLYSFWITPHAQGQSRGYVAAGGPGFTGPVDAPGGGIAAWPALPYTLDPSWPRLTAKHTLQETAGVAALKSGETLVFHRGTPQMLRLDPEGKAQSHFGEGLFSRPHSARIDPEGNIWTADAGTHVVLKHDPTGKVLMVMGRKNEAGEAQDRFNQPTDIAFAPNGDFFVTDGYGNSRVVKYSRNGAFVKAWGKKGAGPGDFNLPHTAVVLNNKLYVGDRENYRIQVFDLDGRFLEEWNEIGSPWGLATSASGHLWMADGHNNRILKLSPKGKVLGTIGETGKLPGQFRFAHMIDVDAQNRVYVTEILNWRVQRFIPK
ncbi:MAG: peptidyl-alpha-hydroxyglycine alpha-amidating lyase family protein [Bryobacteraceae bacterium]